MKNNKKWRKRKYSNMCGFKSDTNFSMENKKKRAEEPSIKNKATSSTINQVSGKCNDKDLKNNKNKHGLILNASTRENKSATDTKKDAVNKDKKIVIPAENKEYSDTSRKKCTGSNNWQNFLLQQGKKYVVSEVPGVDTKKQDTKTTKTKKNIPFTKVIGMDCEMVGIGEDGKDNLLARVSIVNLFGDCLYDKFVKPSVEVTDYRTHVSGVRPSDLKNADDFDTVQKEVAALIKNRILVGHALKNDLEVLFLSHPRYLVRDTAKFFRKKSAGTPSLKSLAAKYLNVSIQSGEHSSVQDAQAAVQLYNLYRKQWETGARNKKNTRIDTLPNS